jgi:hypothetical protein
MPGELVLSSDAPAPAVPAELGRRRYLTREERDAAIVELGVRGVAPHMIERAIDASRGTIYRVLRDARAGGVAVPFFRTSGAPIGRPRVPARTVVVPRELLDELERPARRRGLSAVGLAREIIRAVVEDDMIDAVLDDAGDEVEAVE